jgi:hypothetical protein
MKKMLMAMLATGMLLMAAPAMADDQPAERFRFIGIGFDVGAPDGAALGVVGRIPNIHWLRLELAATRALAFGVRGSATLDPIKFPVGLTLTTDLGHSFDGKVPGVDKSPDISYTYFNLQPGLEFGNRDSFRFVLRAGLSYIGGTAANFQQLVNAGNGISVGDPSFHGWVAPSAKIGFQWLF